jgi:hypothetical protein
VSQAEIEEGLKEPDYPNWIDNLYTPFSGQIPIIKSTQKKKKQRKKKR